MRGQKRLWYVFDFRRLHQIENQQHLSKSQKTQLMPYFLPRYSKVPQASLVR